MSEKESVLETLAEELRANPEGAIMLLEAMTNVVRPWESLRSEGQSVMHAYRRLTAMGVEVALIESSAPTWILTIGGERFTGGKVFNRKGAEVEAKALLDAELAERGFVLMDSQA
jgi:hypothetical protein